MNERSRRLLRHHLVWIDPDATPWPTADDNDESARVAVAWWMDAGWPFVVRRQTSPGWPEVLSLGMALPPGAGKRRISLEVEARSVAAWGMPPNLEFSIPLLPAERRPALRRLRTSAQAIGLELALYGSCGLEALTGMTYLAPTSDIDLLFRPADVSQLDRALALLSSWEQKEGWRADGEILLLEQSGEELGVSWREWLATERKCRGKKTVLAKALRSVGLREIAELRAVLPGAEKSW